MDADIRDYGRLLSALKSIGVTVSEFASSDGLERYISINAGDNRGYSGLFAEFTFDINGDFKHVGIWE